MLRENILMFERYKTGAQKEEHSYITADYMWELQTGIRIEQDKGNSRVIAEQIATKNLSEDPEFYSKIKSF